MNSCNNIVIKIGNNCNQDTLINISINGPYNQTIINKRKCGKSNEIIYIESKNSDCFDYDKVSSEKEQTTTSGERGGTQEKQKQSVNELSGAETEYEEIERKIAALDCIDSESSNENNAVITNPTTQFDIIDIDKEMQELMEFMNETVDDGDAEEESALLPSSENNYLEENEIALYDFNANEVVDFCSHKRKQTHKRRRATICGKGSDEILESTTRRKQSIPAETWSVMELKTLRMKLKRTTSTSAETEVEAEAEAPATTTTTTTPTVIPSTVVTAISPIALKCKKLRVNIKNLKTAGTAHSNVDNNYQNNKNVWNKKLRVNVKRLKNIKCEKETEDITNGGFVFIPQEFFKTEYYNSSDDLFDIR